MMQSSYASPKSATLPRRKIVITALGLTQILAWGSSYYLLAVLAKPITADTGWPLAWVVGGLSLGLLMAGFVSPRVGDAIERRGGRPVLATSAILLALGLVGLALAPDLPAYMASWLILGLGMGAGLYDAAFATLGRLYGQRARVSIATLTLFGGFASTACWPLSAVLVSAFGWRGACLIYAAVHLAIVLPLYVLALPRETDRRGSLTGTHRQLPDHERLPIFASARSVLLFVLLAAAITVNSMISTVVSVHLLTILQARDIALAVAVALGALVGPSQVGARAIEMLVSRYHHPVWTLLASTVLVAIGVGALWMGLAVISAALVFYGAGIGLESIARGTLPLAIFGEKGYAAIMGRIAMPSLIAQAASPSLGALLMERIGADGTLAILFATAIVGLLLALTLFALLPRQKTAEATAS
jgi:predicted MFS family arabinose efflux permease